MALSTYDAIVAALPNAQIQALQKASLTSVAGGFASLWKATGQPAAGSTPATGSGTACDSTTVGAVPFTNPGGGALSYLFRNMMACQQAGVVFVADRLVTTSGLSSNTVATQTVNTVALPRYTNGVYVEIWLEVYTAIGASNVSGTVSYTNQAGVSGRTATLTVAMGGSATAGRMFRCTLQSGDTGVLSVQSLTLAGTTGTAGDIGITLLYTVGFLALSTTSYQGISQTVFQGGMPRIMDSPCIFLYQLTNTTATGALNGELVFIQGLDVATNAQVLAAIGPQTRVDVNKTTTTTTIGGFGSTWTATPNAGVAPTSTTGVACDKNTAGALSLRDPAAGKSLYVARFSGSIQFAQVYYLADRIGHLGGLLGSTTSAQTVTTAALGRYASGVGVEAWVELYGAWTTTTANVTITYTNTAGVAGRVSQSVNIPASALAGRMFLLPLQAGDLGILSIQSVTIDANAGTVGNWGITLLRRLVGVPNPVANDPTLMVGHNILGLPPVQTSACLFMMALATVGGTGQISAYWDIIDL